MKWVREVRVGLTARPWAKIVKGDSGAYYNFNHDFENWKGTIAQFANKMDHGHAFTALLKRPADGRITDNFYAAQHIALDFDKGNLTIDSLMALPILEKWAAVIYGTQSFVPEENRRWRVVIFMDRPEFDAMTYSEYVRACVWATGGLADTQTVDAVRAFYGKGKASPPAWSVSGGVIPPVGNLPMVPRREILEPNIDNPVEMSRLAVTIRDLVEIRRAALEILAERNPTPKVGNILTGQSSSTIRNPQAVVNWWLRKVAWAAPGDSNHQLNAAAWALSDLVSSGLVDGGGLADTLLTAAVGRNIPEKEAMDVIKSAMRKKGVWSNYW